MKIEKNNIENSGHKGGASEIEIAVELSVEEMKPYLEEAAKKISENVKVEGFRPGHVPYSILKQQVDEMQILQEAADLAIRKTADKILQEKIDVKEENVMGQPQVNITKLAVGNPMEYKLTLATMPEIKLGAYKNLKIKEQTVEVDEKEVEKILGDLRAMRAKEKIVDREIKEDDKVMVNIQMFLDNVPIEGGQGKDMAVMVGANYIVPGFDKKLIGAKKADKREFKLPYPKEHHQQNLAGKMVEFKVEIKEVYERELPEINDEFAKAMGLKNVEKLKNQIKENVKQEKEKQAEQKVVLEIFEAILNKTEFSHVPEGMIHAEIHNMIHELKHNIEQWGGKFDDYLVHIKKTPQDLEKDLHPDATKRVKTSLIISQIVKAEDIKVADEDLKKAIDAQMVNYANNPEMSAQGGSASGWKKKLESEEFKNYIHYNLLNQKVIGKLKEWNMV